MKIFLESNLPVNLISAGKNPSMCPQTADMWPEISATSEFGPKWGPKFTQIFQHLLNQCAWWVHILARAPGDERHSYRLSIHGSIDFGPCVLVSTCGTCFWSTRKSHIFGQFCPCTNKDKTGQKQAIFGCSRNKCHKSILSHMTQNRYYHGLKAYISVFHPPECGPVCAPTRHTSSTNVENFG